MTGGDPGRGLLVLLAGGLTLCELSDQAVMVGRLGF